MSDKTRTSSATAVARMLESRLRRAFPGIRFSVHRARGTAANWVRVMWVDGPAEGAVHQVCGLCADVAKGVWIDGVTIHRGSIDRALMAALGWVRTQPERWRSHAGRTEETAARRALAEVDLAGGVPQTAMEIVS